MTAVLILVPILAVVGGVAFVADRYGRRGHTSDDVARAEARHRHPSAARRRRREDPWAAALAQTTELPVLAPRTSAMRAIPPVPAGRHAARV